MIILANLGDFLLVLINLVYGTKPMISRSIYDGGEPAVKLQMNQLSLRNNRLKFKTAEKLLIVLDEFNEYTPIQ